MSANILNFDLLDQTLRTSLEDLRLCNDERNELRQLGSGLHPDQIRFMRNRAFALVTELAAVQDNVLPALKWLEQVVKTLDGQAPQPLTPASAHFSPGESCRAKILELCRQAQRSVEICVFTISDDPLSEAIVECHRRGLAVRVITDDDKQHDAGSDVQRLIEQGVDVRFDTGPFHMHHKFALFDRRFLLNGSFNWTRSATTSNAENLTVMEHPQLVTDFAREFDKLWRTFGPRRS